MSPSSFDGFSPKLVTFLRKLHRNNNREWFRANKNRYEADVREPALDFIAAMAAPLAKLAPHFVAMPKKTGGSLMRPYRDTRFSKDKTPYKTNVGIQFRHELGRDVHAPGYYFHIDPENVFVGVGIWHPDSKTLAAIRDFIVDNPGNWKRTRDNNSFRSHYTLDGDSLKRPPRGYDKDHPFIDDLKRKDFIAVKTLTHDDVYRSDFVQKTVAEFKAAGSFMRFLCTATGTPF